MPPTDVYPSGLTCAELRAECARGLEKRDEAICDKLDSIASDVKEVKEIQVRVAALENWRAMLNGRAAALAEASAAYPHHRPQDETEHLHQRAVAATTAAELAAAAATKAIEAVAAHAKANPATTDGLPGLPRWAVLGLAGFVLLVIVLLVSDKQYERMKKPLPVPSPMLPK